jgi:hypothetical protein
MHVAPVRVSEYAVRNGVASHADLRLLGAIKWMRLHVDPTAACAWVVATYGWVGTIGGSKIFSMYIIYIYI